jgi:uncharacterized protein (TIGR04255 family)
MWVSAVALLWKEIQASICFDGTANDAELLELGMGYKKPLLIEVFSELDLGASLDGSRVIDIAMGLRAVGYSSQEFVGALRPAIDPFQPRIRCWSADKRKLVQLSSEQIVVNQVGDYLGWGSFLDSFKGVLSHLGDLPSLAPTALSIQAIDRLRVNEPDFALGQFFACDGERIPRWYANCNEACDITLGRGLVPQDSKNRQIALRLRKAPPGYEVQLTTSFKNRLHGAPDMLGVLDELHAESNELFEALITDKTRQHMGGKQ